jgi:hypothetical protein
MTDDQDRIYELMDYYNGMIEPIESWATADISRLITLLDAELQRRYDEVRHLVEGLSGLSASSFEELNEDEDAD